MSENQKKWWKLTFIVVPVVVAQIGSYAKSRAESKDETKASYEALSKAFTELKKDSDEDHDHLAALEGRVVVPTITALHGHHDQLRAADHHQATNHAHGAVRRRVGAGGRPSQLQPGRLPRNPGS